MPNIFLTKNEAAVFEKALEQYRINRQAQMKLDCYGQKAGKMTKTEREEKAKPYERLLEVVKTLDQKIKAAKNESK